jgi:acyl-CoA thioesterase
MRAAHVHMQSFSSIVARRAEPRENGATLRADTTPDWLQGKAMFGGLQGALGVLAMRVAVGDALPLRALQMTFVAAVDEGPAVADASVVRRGRAVTHAQCTLSSNGRPAALLVGLFGAARDSKAIADMPMPELRRPADLKEVPYMPGVMPGFLQHYRQRWAGGAIPFSGAGLKPASMWARLREAVPGDGAGRGDLPAPASVDLPAGREANVVALTDLPAAPVMATLTRRAPGASLTWLLELLHDPRELDPRDWLMLHTETRHAAEGYTSQTARIWTESGRPVAVSHQTTAIFD